MSRNSSRSKGGPRRSQVIRTSPNAMTVFTPNGEKMVYSASEKAEVYVAFDGSVRRLAACPSRTNARKRMKEAAVAAAHGDFRPTLGAFFNA